MKKLCLDRLSLGYVSHSFPYKDEDSDWNDDEEFVLSLVISENICMIMICIKCIFIWQKYRENLELK